MFSNIYWIKIQVKAFLLWWLMTFWGFDSSAASCSTLQHNLNIGRGIHRHSFLGASIQRFAEKYITPTVLFLEKEMLNIAVTSRPAEPGKKRLISERVSEAIFGSNLSWDFSWEFAHLQWHILHFEMHLFSGQQNAQTAKSNYRP